MDQHPKVELIDGTLRLNFGEYGQEVEFAAISADGCRVLTVREVGLAEVWDTASGARIGTIRPDSPLQGSDDTAPVAGSFKVFIEAAALNRDGSIALLGLNDGTAGTFTVHDGRRLATLHRPSVPAASSWSVIRAVAFSPDGTLALVGFPGRSAGVWSEHGDRLVAMCDAPSGDQLVGTPFVRDTLVSSLAMSSDNRWLFTGHADGTVAIWDVGTATEVFTATQHAEEVIALFDDEHGFGWATTNGSVWRSRSGAAPEKVLACGEHWAEARFHGTTFLTRSFRHEIKRWKFSGESDVLFAPAEPTQGMWASTAESLAFGGEWIAYPEGGTSVTARRGQETYTINRGAQLVTTRFTPDATAVATAGWKDEVELWAVPGGRLLQRFSSAGGVGDFAFSPDGTLIAIGEVGHGGGHYPRHVRVYRTADGRLIQSITEDQWQVRQVAFSADGTLLAALGDTIVVWDVKRWRVRARIDAERSATSFQFLRDGRLLVVGEDRVRVFRGSDKILECPAPVRYGTVWCVSADDRTLNVSLKQGVARIDLSTGLSLGTSMAPIPRPAYVPDEVMARQVAARSGAAVWSTDFGTYLRQGDGPRGWVQPVHLSPEGIVAIPARDGAALIHVGIELTLLGTVPFTGKLRATRVVNGEVVLVNHEGVVFRHPLPARALTASS
jgi:WD40 repeat protein